MLAGMSQWHSALVFSTLELIGAELDSRPTSFLFDSLKKMAFNGLVS